MRDITPLMLDLLEFVGPQGRPYSDVLDAWRTSCPRLPVWEEVNDQGLVARRRDEAEARVELTAAGRAFLAARRH